MTIQADIEQALSAFSGADRLREQSTALLRSIGYSSSRTVEISSVQEFIAWLGRFKPMTQVQESLFDVWRSVEIMFQLTSDEITEQVVLFQEIDFDASRIKSFLFVAVELNEEHYTRGYLARATRIVNRSLPMPVVIIYKHGPSITMAVIHRRPNRIDETRDVLEGTTMIKDISVNEPHRAQLDTLANLSLGRCIDEGVQNFDELYEAWEKALDTEALNRQFYNKLFRWFQRAVNECKFPDDGAGTGCKERHVIRLITRLLFVWFMKEKGLVPEALFEEEFAYKHLRNHGVNRTDYYQAILQNLFFATLNVQISKRRFRSSSDNNDNTQSEVTEFYRYEDLMENPSELTEILDRVPFVNGGLFDSLDDLSQHRVPVFIDAFDDAIRTCPEILNVPSYLFFDSTIGLFPFFRRYKFTVEENTPLDQEVALDPELLGRVFENLLAAYNPETPTPVRESIRKSTGSYYTPRQIVDYLVDEAIVSALVTKSPPPSSPPQKQYNHKFWRNEIRKLLNYEQSDEEMANSFASEQVSALVSVIAQLRVLDPAVGSGAFPMSVLHKLTLILRRLDPTNEHWAKVQMDFARKRLSAVEVDSDESWNAMLMDIKNTFETYRESDYGRKLYLIQNVIFGVDVQPIACQIARLRFFISLIVEQQKNTCPTDNYGIRPLPNLDTRFVAANTLIPLGTKKQEALGTEVISQTIDSLQMLRERYFNADAKHEKQQLQIQDRKLRNELSDDLKALNFGDTGAEAIANWDPYRQNSSTPWFSPEWMFGISEGFDIVVGNPPYVRADIQDVRQQEVRQRVIGCGQYETLWKKWDLYVAFIERSHKLLKEGGVSSLIVSDAFCNAPYASKARKWYAKHAIIDRIDFYSDIKIFDAAVHNISYLMRRGTSVDHIPLRRRHLQSFGTVTEIDSGTQREMGDMLFRNESASATNVPAMQSIDGFVSLCDICYSQVGMVCNAHEVKASESFRLGDLTSEYRDKVHSRMFVEGKDLARWFRHTVRWLEWGTRRAPSQFRRPTFPELYDRPEKVLARGLATTPEASYDNEQLLFNHSVIGFIRWCDIRGVSNRSIAKRARYRAAIRSEIHLDRAKGEAVSTEFNLKYLLGIMNSSRSIDYLNRRRRSNINIYPDDWLTLPIPRCSSEKQSHIAALVDQILIAKSLNPLADVSEHERNIDALVDELYSVNP